MNRFVPFVLGLALIAATSLAAQEKPAAAPSDKPVLVVQPFTAGQGVEWPYDMKTMQAQTVAELKVTLGKEFAVVAEPPTDAKTNVYTLAVDIVEWRHGSAAKRLLVGFGSGREACDIHYTVTDQSNKTVLDKKDTIRTNYFSQGAGSVGTLAHPIAQKMSERIEDAKLK